ncbi:MAG TPA: L-rhamnose/proton symporter RhaT [Puia sp.]|nr:L-rhamnose/proton symporter RhaT [Puia sp.]
MNVIIGLSMLILGGISAGSSYVPLKGIKGWAWESLWAVQGIVAWLLLPLLLALLATPHLFAVLQRIPFSTLAMTFAFGFLWGVGGLAWGMAVRYIGLALGFTIATGFLSSLGTLVPIIVAGRFSEVAATGSGKITLISVFMSLVGIVVCGKAGMRRDKEAKSGAESGGQKGGDSIQADRQDEIVGTGGFQFKKGVLIAFAAGVLGACFAFGITTGEPIRQQAIGAGASPVWAASPVFFVELLGGITVNLLYCVVMNRRNRTFSDYRRAKDAGTLRSNYAFSALIGALWYLQFVFYGMAAFYMGPYSFANWSVHMSFMVVASNLWGYYFKEWKGVSATTIRWNTTGILILVIAGIMMGVAGSQAATGG